MDGMLRKQKEEHQRKYPLALVLMSLVYSDLDLAFIQLVLW